MVAVGGKQSTENRVRQVAGGGFDDGEALRGGSGGGTAMTGAQAARQETGGNE